MLPLPKLKTGVYTFDRGLRMVGFPASGGYGSVAETSIEGGEVAAPVFGV